MEDQNKTHIHKYHVHRILAHSYSVYFVLFLIGVSLDLIFNFKIFNNSFAVPLGVFFLMFGTFLIIWAQETSRKLNKENITKETFRHGPYRYTRGPTHLGLFFLMLGFGIIINAFFVILFTLVALVVTKFVFLSKEEKVLEEKYGAPYREYKKSVKF